MKKVCSWKTVGFCFLVFIVTLIADIKLSHAQEQEQLSKTYSLIMQELVMHPENADIIKEYFWTYYIPALVQTENSHLPERQGQGVILFNVTQIKTILVWNYEIPVGKIVLKDKMIKDTCKSANTRFPLAIMGGSYVYKFYYEGQAEIHDLLFIDETNCKEYSV